MDASNINIRRLREFHGLTIDEFASVLGYDQSYISLIESGKRDVSAQFVSRLMEKFHIKPEKILNDHVD